MVVVVEKTVDDVKTEKAARKEAATADAPAQDTPTVADTTIATADATAAGNAAPAEAASASVMGLKVGDIGLGFSAKFKSSFDNQRCKIVAILSQQYKVEMLTGDSKGKLHKYQFKAAQAIATQAPATLKSQGAIASETAAAVPAASSGDVQPLAAPSVAEDSLVMQSLQDLFDSVA